MTAALTNGPAARGAEPSPASPRGERYPRGPRTRQCSASRSRPRSSRHHRLTLESPCAESPTIGMERDCAWPEEATGRDDAAAATGRGDPAPATQLVRENRRKRASSRREGFRRRPRATYLMRAARRRRRDAQSTPWLLLRCQAAKRRQCGARDAVVALHVPVHYDVRTVVVRPVAAAEQREVFLAAGAQARVALARGFAVEAEQQRARRPMVEAVDRVDLAPQLPLEVRRHDAPPARLPRAVRADARRLVDGAESVPVEEDGNASAERDQDAEEQHAAERSRARREALAKLSQQPHRRELLPLEPFSAVYTRRTTA